MTRLLRQLTWARWRFFDPYDSRYYTVFTATIPLPSYEFPVASAMMSVSNAGGRVLMRFATLQALRQVFVIPPEYAERLEENYRLAVIEAARVQEQFKAMMKMGSLPPGAQVVRTDTGEIIAEAERIINGDHQ